MRIYCGHMQTVLQADASAIRLCVLRLIKIYSRRLALRFLRLLPRSKIRREKLDAIEAIWPAGKASSVCLIVWCVRVCGAAKIAINLTIAGCKN